MSEQGTLVLLNLAVDKQLTSDELVAIVPQEEIVQPPVKQNACSDSSKSSSRKPIATSKDIPIPINIKTEGEESAPALNKSNEKAREDNGKKRRVLKVTSNNIRVDNLPDFAKDKTWRNNFLPTLYDKFFASSKPFSQFAKGSKEFVSLLQVVMNEVYPHVKYKVSALDTIHALVILSSVRNDDCDIWTNISPSQAYNRVNEKRSTVGSNAVKIVENHIRTLDGTKASRDWLLWASRGDGPLFFTKPVAPDAPLDRKDPNYVVSLPLT